MSKYDPETRAAVMAGLLQGQSITQAAEAYRIPRSTVARWRKKAHTLLQDVPTEGVAQVEEIGALLIRYLRAGLEAVAKQQEVFADLTWLREQRASELAVLHGVQLDKLVRLLEAMEGAPVKPIPPTGNGNRVRQHGTL